MTPGAIIALVKDVIILIALALFIVLLITFGKDIVKVQDMKEFKKQFEQNAKIEAQFRKDQSDANDKHDKDLAAVSATISQQRAPVLMCRQPPAAKQLPGNPTAPSTGPAAAGPVDPGARGDSGPVDIRPQLNGYELRVEKVVADCRRAIEGWPTIQR